MKANEYGAWPSHNISDKNSKYYVDGYNRSFLKERYEVPGGYATDNISEYYRTPNMYREEYGKKKEDTAKSSRDRKDKNARQLRQRMLQQVVGLVAGSVVITTSYQAVIREQAAAQQPDAGEPDAPAPVSYMTDWHWSEDNRTVTVVLTDADGNVVKELTAVVTVSEEPPTCNTEGVETYTATAEDEGTTYKDSRSEPLAPLGHDFGEGEETVLANGHTAMTFECARCHEEFTIATSMTENE